MNSVQIEAIPVTSYVSDPPNSSDAEIAASEASVSLASGHYPQLSKPEVRTSLRASTLDGVFAAIFSNIAGGVLLSNFLVELHASPIEIGLLSSVPMLANLLQPLGAHLSEQTTSRHQYCLWIYGSSRLLWLMLAVSIGLASLGQTNPHYLVAWTLGVALVSYVLGALGSASWMSWMATLVPQRLRGRYFGLRNSAASLTTLICVPLAGWMVSSWPGGTLQGYGVALAIGVVAGLLSLGFQIFIKDINPRLQQVLPSREASRKKTWHEQKSSADQLVFVEPSEPNIWKNRNFLVFLLYFALWMFAVNLSAPFFNIYMLDTLDLDVSWVTAYSSLMSGAHLLMMILWGKVADRIGNRPILLLVGTLVAVTPLLWLGTDVGLMSVWLWLPLLHLLQGGTWAAIDLCTNNIQLEIASVRHQSVYFAIAAAVAGVSGALGTTMGGFLAQFANCGGLLGLFALSSVLRLAALLPLVFVQEQRGRSLKQILQAWIPQKMRPRAEF